MLDSSWWNKSSRTYQDLDQRNFYLLDQKKFLSFKLFLLESNKNHMKNHAYLTDSQ